MNDKLTITLKDLLKSESDVLQRIGQEIRDEQAEPVQAAGHTKHLKAHQKAAPHNKYTARIETPPDPEQ